LYITLQCYFRACCTYITVLFKGLLYIHYSVISGPVVHNITVLFQGLLYITLQCYFRVCCTYITVLFQGLLYIHYSVFQGLLYIHYSVISGFVVHTFPDNMSDSDDQLLLLLSVDVSGVYIGCFVPSSVYQSRGICRE
jgi:hypothetical protein